MDWLYQYMGNCDVAIREAYKHGQQLLWICYPNWVGVVLILGLISAFIVALLMAYLNDKNPQKITKLKVRVD
jgi:hypothetical protein